MAARGRIRINGREAAARDGIAAHDENMLRVEAVEESEAPLADVRA